MIQLVSQQGSLTMPKYPYEQLADTLRERIASGEFPPGAKLPSRSELSAEYKVSDIVVGRAMWILRQEGLTETLPGVGVYVAERPSEEPAD